MVQRFDYTTGPSSLPTNDNASETHVLSYNGCIFSPLFETKISGKVVKDSANRTTKYMEYVLSADGYVTLPEGARSILPNMNTLRDLLTVHAGKLIYKGRGFDLVINAAQADVGGAKQGSPLVLDRNTDVAWGPVPELIEFQPLGAGRSAKVQWKVTVRVPEIAGKTGLLQLNYETSTSYGEDQFSSLSITGTIEIPMTRRAFDDRRVVRTVDEFRDALEERILRGIDLDRFRLTRRDFNVSRDKRTLDFNVGAEERPYMDMPPNCTLARGTYNVRQAKAGMGLVSWLCTLKATYTVRKGVKRRTAWHAFLALLRVRMYASFDGDVPNFNGQAPRKPDAVQRGIRGGIRGLPIIGQGLALGLDLNDYHKATVAAKPKTEHPNRRVWLMDFNIDEGLYLDSKTVTFSATWRLLCKFAYILLGSGIWKKVVERTDTDQNVWAASMRSISGATSWLPNRLDPSLDVIVDFGGP